mgnify:CR=1 FL=1
MTQDLFRLVISNASGIAIFFIAVLLLIREIFTFYANERRRKGGDWVYMKNVQDTTTRIEGTLVEFKGLFNALISLEKTCNESQTAMYSVLEKDLEIARENREKLDYVCKNCTKRLDE